MSAGILPIFYTITSYLPEWKWSLSMQSGRVNMGLFFPMDITVVLSCHLIVSASHGYNST